QATGLMGLSIERMSRAGPKSSIPVRYGGALACALGAVLLRAAMGPQLAGRVPNAASFLACLVAARVLGLRPAGGVIAAALGGAFLFGHRPEAGREALFLVMSALAVWIVEILQRSKAHAEEQARLAAERLAELEKAAALRREEERISS